MTNAYAELFLTEAFGALGNDNAIGLLLKVFHTGLDAGRGFDGFRFAIANEFDRVAFCCSFEGLRTIEIRDLDRVLVTLLSDVQV